MMIYPDQLSLFYPTKPKKPLFPSSTWNDWEFLIDCGYSEKTLMQRFAYEQQTIEDWKAEKADFQKYLRHRKEC